MAIATSTILIETHGFIQRYYTILQKAYKVITDDMQGCGLNKKMVLQIAIKAINNTAGPNVLVPTLLIFGAYLYISKFDAPTPIII